MSTMTINLNAKAVYTNPFTKQVTETWMTSREDEGLRTMLSSGLDGLSSRIDPEIFETANLSTLVDTPELADRARQAFEKLQEITGFVGSITKPDQVNTRNGIKYSVKLWKDKTKAVGLTIDI